MCLFLSIFAFKIDRKNVSKRFWSEYLALDLWTDTTVVKLSVKREGKFDLDRIFFRFFNDIVLYFRGKKVVKVGKNKLPKRFAWRFNKSNEAQ